MLNNIGHNKRKVSTVKHIYNISVINTHEDEPIIMYVVTCLLSLILMVAELSFDGALVGDLVGILDGKVGNVDGLREGDCDGISVPFVGDVDGL